MHQQRTMLVFTQQGANIAFTAIVSLKNLKWRLQLYFLSLYGDNNEVHHVWESFEMAKNV